MQFTNIFRAHSSGRSIRALGRSRRGWKTGTRIPIRQELIITVRRPDFG